MKKKKLTLTKETVKNLTLDADQLGDVAGGGIGAGYTGGSTNWCPNTGSTCHSCGSSCLACPGFETTIYINPNPFTPIGG